MSCEGVVMSASSAVRLCARVIAVGLGGGALCALPAAGANDSSSPNVVVVLADDLGYDQTSLYHRTGAIPTPHIAGLADNGVRLGQGYVASPVCSPSRSALLTGREPARVGADSNFLARARPERMPTRTIARALPEKYSSIAIGKWDLAGAQPFDESHLPAAMGFDDFYGFQGGMHDYCVPAPGTTNLKEYRPNTGAYANVASTRYLTDEFTQRAVDYVNDKAPASDANPFFMYLAYNAPHDPLETPRTCGGRQQSESDRFRDMVQIMDNGVGRVRDALARQGIADNTIVVFLSDNGQQHDYFTGQTRGGKYTLFEGGVKVPFAMSWPGVLPEGAHYDKPVSSLDLYPTILRAAGGGLPPGMPGVDLVPFLTGQDGGIPHEDLSWRYVNDHNVLGEQGTVIEAQRSGDLKWIRGTTPANPVTSNYLFDLAADPRESTNQWPGPADPLLADHHAWNSGNPVTESFGNVRAGADVRAGHPDGYVENGGTWGVTNHSYRGAHDGRSMLELSWYGDAVTSSTMRLTEPGRAGVVVRGSGAAEPFDGYVGGLSVPRSGSSVVYLAKVVAGRETVVDYADVSLTLGSTARIEVRAVGRDLTVSLAGETVLSWTDTSPTARRAGRAGLWVGGAATAEFGTLNSRAST
jgi:arylsulfatase A-like enzyme